MPSAFKEGFGTTWALSKKDVNGFRKRRFALVWLDHRFGGFGSMLGACKAPCGVPCWACFGTMLGAFKEGFEWLQKATFRTSLEMSPGALRVALAPCWALSMKDLNGFRKRRLA